MENKFKLVSPFSPAGDQPEAIDELTRGLESGVKHQVLLGVTGSGKTFTMANVIQRVQRPALVIAHNKTLAAQLYSEFKAFFPDNAVEYFVSYYDYYQPEAYLPSTGTYIEKDSAINEEIDKMRHSATRSLFERRDVIIVASVSCIYGLGSPEAYFDMKVTVARGQTMERDALLESLVGIRYDRNNIDFKRGTFRVNGDTVEVLPIYETDTAVRIEFFGDEVDSITRVDPLTGKLIGRLDSVNIYPGSHYVTPPELMEKALVEIQHEMETAHEDFLDQQKYVEAQRIRERTLADIEMIKAIGYCNGIENYSRIITGRAAGTPPPTLMEYFPKDAVIIVDESHQTIPQIGAMLKGDRSRKQTLVGYGFRLPSAYDNRPLSFEEFEGHVNQVIYVSATPAPYELNKTEGVVVEQVVRPTGLIDPPVQVRPATSQVDDLLDEVNKRTAMGLRSLVGALTKRQAEDLTDYMQGLGVRARYLHSDIATLERMAIINELREGLFDALIGINLLREGLDIPEVGLVAILNADSEGFLRSETALIQTSGRAARNSQGLVVLYADRITGSMQRAMDEMNRRRQLQIDHNTLHGITPISVQKGISNALAFALDKDDERKVDEFAHLATEGIERLIGEYDAKMKAAAAELDFETAAQWRDKIKKLRLLEMI